MEETYYKKGSPPAVIACLVSLSLVLYGSPQRSGRRSLPAGIAAPIPAPPLRCAAAPPVGRASRGIQAQPLVMSGPVTEEVAAGASPPPPLLLSPRAAAAQQPFVMTGPVTEEVAVGERPLLPVGWEPVVVADGRECYVHVATQHTQ